MNIKQQLVSNSLAKKASFGTGNPKKFITVHQTGNTAKGANAQTHANLQSRGYSASWHWQVDDKEAIQSFSHDWRLWHAGDNTGKGNMESIAIEICINSDGDYLRSVKNGAKLVAKIMKDENISIDRVVQHNYWSGKNCPKQIRAGQAGINWNQFIGLVKGDASGGTTATKPKPEPQKPAKKSIDQIAQEVISNKHGNYPERKTNLEALGYNYQQVQDRVNEIVLGTKPATKPVKKSGTWLVTTPVGMKVRSAPSTSAAKVASYQAGQTVNINSTVTQNGYIWGVYTSYSGYTRYIALQPVNGAAYGKWI